MGLELFFVINHYHHSIIYFYSILLVLVKGSSSIMDVLDVCVRLLVNVLFMKYHFITLCFSDDTIMNAFLSCLLMNLLQAVFGGGGGGGGYMNSSSWPSCGGYY